MNTIRWRLRRWFWDRLATFKLRRYKPTPVPVPTGEQRPVLPVPLATRLPGVPIESIAVADHIPRDEVQWKHLLFSRFQAWMYRVIPPMQPGLPSVASDPERALADAYTPAHRRLFARPRRPPEYENGIDLGQLAVASPYACYLEEDSNVGFRWDLSMLEKFDCYRELLRPWAVVEFVVDPQKGRLEAVRIDSELGSSRPGEPDWGSAKRLALCAATTHVSLVRHFNWIHLVGSAQTEMATRNCLPATHPVRRLLWPHLYGTLCNNEVVGLDLMIRGGDFESIFSFTHPAMCELFEATWGEFDLSRINPSTDAIQRRVVKAGFEAPALENRLTLMNVLEDHASRYLKLYYADDDALADNEPFRRWLEELDRSLPNGVGKLVGGDVTLEGAATLLSTIIYLATVEHEIVGSGVWNYQLWSDVNPVRVCRDGSREAPDVYQRLVNTNFNLNGPRTPLLSDFSHMALDERGAKAFVQFRDDLHTVQADYDRRRGECWRIEPRMLKANINA